jgi:negative regulator of flagellin synthesis FlgM
MFGMPLLFLTAERDKPVKIENAPQSAKLIIDSNIKPKKAEPQGLTAGPSVIATLNRDLSTTAEDIDMAKVNEIRTAISEGRLEINAERIADALIQSMRDFA